MKILLILVSKIDSATNRVDGMYVPEILTLSQKIQIILNINLFNPNHLKPIQHEKDFHYGVCPVGGNGYECVGFQHR